MLLMKVGKYEHLELLRNGHVHLNPLSRFRDDETNFRGDALEGSYRLDINKGIYINGVDISKIGEGLEVVMFIRLFLDITGYRSKQSRCIVEK